MEEERNESFHYTSGQQGWGDSANVMLGEPFDRVDTLLRLCRNPCDHGKDDTTKCRCDTPCRLRDFETVKHVYDSVVEDEAKAFYTEDEDCLRRTRPFNINLKPSVEKNPVSSFFNACWGHAGLPGSVGIELAMLELLDTDEEKGNFEALIRMTVSWYDPAFDTKEWHMAGESGSLGVNVTSYNAPKISFRDVLEGEIPGFHDNVEKVYLPLGDQAGPLVSRPDPYNPDEIWERPIRLGVVSKKVEMTLKVRDDNPIQNFPFDKQELTVEVEIEDSGTPGTKDYGRFLVPLSFTFESQHEMITWNFHRPVAHVTSSSGSPQRLVVAFRMSRQPWTYIYNVLLIMFATATLTCGAFFVPLDALADRSAITLTILLTAVAFKLVLQDGLPNVPYLTFLDRYVLVCFFTIVMVALENNFVAFIHGVEKTVSCGNHCANETGVDEHSVFSGGGSADLDTAITIEMYFCIFLGWFWLLYNLYMGGKAMYLTHKTSESWGSFVRVQSEEIPEEDRVEQLQPVSTTKNPNFMMKAVKSIRKKSFKHVDEKKQRQSADSNVSIHRYPSQAIPDNKYNTLLASATTMPCPPHIRQLLQRFVRSAQWSPVLRNMEGTLANAGLKLFAKSMAAVAIDCGLSLDLFKEMETTILWELLKRLKLSVDERASLAVAARKQVDVIFLQGSASYLVKELNMEGKQVTKLEVIAAIEERLETVCHGKMKLQTFANLLLGRTLFNSSVTPALHLFAQRECQTDEGVTIHTQLWAGYALQTSKLLFEKNPDKEVIRFVVVDLGSGEFKRFIVEVKRGRPVTLLYEFKDKKYPGVYKEEIRQAKDAYVKAFKDKGI
eukprot:m.7688 g.7688  ORF g.7688 m.7688 type:complete len:836 (+) comp3755_c0_seq1:97-2604(+)